MKINPVVHFEMPLKDENRLIDFYTKAFGWKLQKMGTDYGNYITAMTSETDEKGHPKNVGTIHGGFYPLNDEKVSPYPSVVISVDNIKEHIKIVEQAGGKIIGEPMEIPKVGKFVSFTDTEGNRVSMLEPSPEMKNM